MARAGLIEADVAVVGAGAAGLYAALTASRAGARVALVSATALARTASYWAQGGLAAALAVDDSPERHLEDTLAAGRAAGRESTARVLCEDAPARVRELAALGVRFDADRFGRLALGLEGGHSVRRVVHAGGSATGRRITRQLSADVVEDERIVVLEAHRAAALEVHDGRCTGLVCHDGTAVAARGVVLASGGAAALWSRTTNPPGAFGSGLLLALKAGAAVADLELMQFHPTAVVDPRRTDTAGRRRRSVEGFLITEAIRGEGAILVDAAGERFVDELAPRDEVARAIRTRLLESGASAVGLDMRMVDPRRFPNVVNALRDAGIEPTRELVPVAPAAHYLMGGVATDAVGRARLPGLYAVGECACTGLHGANRLASNSLSECFVFGRRAALAVLDEPPPSADGAPRGDADLETAATTLPAPDTRAAVWELAGLERDREGLERLRAHEHPLARLVATSALAREESRGAHWRRDHPDRDAALDRHHSVLAPGADPVFEEWT
jgi:L-aspartate oxidase